MMDPWERCLESLEHPELFETLIKKPFRRGLRLHTSRGSLSSSWQEVERIAWTKHGYFHADKENPAGFLDYHTGRVYPQDGASQLPPILLNPQKGEIILDACAAPGSKTTAVALALEDTGCVIASDINPARRRVIRETAARQGLINIAVTTLSLSELADHDVLVDGALVDVPCSGHEKRSRKQIMKMQAKQLRILEQAARCVRPGGRMVYSTCTMYFEENEDVIELFLEHNPEWHLQIVDVPGVNHSEAGAIRFWPQDTQTEPFFCALLVHAGGAVEPSIPRQHVVSVSNPLMYAKPDGIYLQELGAYLIGSNQTVAELDIPLEGRGLLIAESIGAKWKMNQWAAQSYIERGAESHVISYDDACALWSGQELGVISEPVLLKTACGAPLGLSRSKELRLNMSSRAFRTVR